MLELLLKNETNQVKKINMTKQLGFFFFEIQKNKAQLEF